MATINSSPYFMGDSVFVVFCMFFGGFWDLIINITHFGAKRMQGF